MYVSKKIYRENLGYLVDTTHLSPALVHRDRGRRLKSIALSRKLGVYYLEKQSEKTVKYKKYKRSISWVTALFEGS